MVQRFLTPLLSSKQFYLLFILMLGLIAVGDGIMSYISPIYIDKIGGNATTMGLVLASSSVMGIVVDFLFAKFFGHQKSKFFVKILFLFVFIFPVSFLLFKSVLAAVVAMLVWGVYFEAIVFSNYNAIHESVAPSDHGWAWGISGVVRNIAYAIGPLLAGHLHDKQEDGPLWAAIVFFACALAVALLYFSLKRFHTHPHTPHIVQTSRSFAEQFGIWTQYARVIWPLLFFNILFFTIESAFFSVGPLLGEELSTVGITGSLFVSLYSIPGVIVGFTIVVLSKPWGKKRLAYTGGLLGGLGLICVGLSTVGWSVLVFGFLGSVGLCLLHPALAAVFEDFIARSKAFGNDLVGLIAMSGSFAYIIGPILNGMIADSLGNKAVFGIWGVVLMLYSIALFFIVKRKVHLPQSQVQGVLNFHSVAHR